MCQEQKERRKGVKFSRRSEREEEAFEIDFM